MSCACALPVASNLVPVARQGPVHSPSGVEKIFSTQWTLGFSDELSLPANSFWACTPLYVYLFHYKLYTYITISMDPAPCKTCKKKKKGKEKREIKKQNKTKFYHLPAMPQWVLCTHFEDSSTDHPANFSTSLLFLGLSFWMPFLPSFPVSLLSSLESGRVLSICSAFCQIS